MRNLYLRKLYFAVKFNVLNAKIKYLVSAKNIAIIQSTATIDDFNGAACGRSLWSLVA
jgi:hypothetical protein